ncbi:hypothetical protein WR43_04855 [Mycolicibacter arupensis]|uniref:Uncharacterized protein n=1 Tax=Mycolicibacter arupensis TaxID=342002 RepID=A0A0F5N2F5_9MYCO|nr:hypothetical protein WR43_04855 [Mycolicibacter arupensis]ORA01054.1 hypothetical protein BST15_00430 [Mycolicibacter arupensis]
MSPELLAHFARYLAVLISGYIEQSVKELIREYSRRQGDSRVQRLVGKHVERFRNIDNDKLKQMLDALDPAWWPMLEAAHADDLEALGSIATLRNNISHGGDSGVSLIVVKGYLERIENVVRWLVALLDPPPT